VRYVFLIAILSIRVTSICAQQVETLSANQINKLVPGNVKGYALKESKSNRLKLGDITYSLCERILIHGNKSVKILLFDYGAAPIMYTQAMQKWSQMQFIETDSVLYRQMQLPSFTGWESYTTKDNRSQLILGIHQRFFLILSGEQITLEELKNILSAFEFDKFPG
jgi:hypothetical protein